MTLMATSFFLGETTLSPPLGYSSQTVKLASLSLPKETALSHSPGSFLVCAFFTCSSPRDESYFRG